MRPQTEVPAPTDTTLARRIRELVGIQYFSGETHKHRAWAWDALNAIAPNLAEMCSNNPKAAYDATHAKTERSNAAGDLPPPSRPESKQDASGG